MSTPVATLPVNESDPSPPPIQTGARGTAHSRPKRAETKPARSPRGGADAAATVARQLALSLAPAGASSARTMRDAAWSRSVCVGVGISVPFATDVVAVAGSER